MAGIEAVRRQIVDAFLGIHGDCRTKEDRQAGEEMHAAIEGDATIQGEADDVSEFIGWVEEMDDVDVEVVTDEATDDVLADCVLTLEQAPPQATIQDVWVEVPRENWQTLCDIALRDMGEGLKGLGE